MHQVMILLKNSQTNIALSYKEHASALLGYQAIVKKMDDGAQANIKDDYGHIMNARADTIATVLLIDVVKEDAANVEREILKRRAAKNFDDRLRTDPVLSFAAAPMTLNHGKLSS